MANGAGFDYAIHSDFLIHWTGWDIDKEYDPEWYCPYKMKISEAATRAYIARLDNILTHGLWMTKEENPELYNSVALPAAPRCCFSELKLSESRRHARRYGRLGIGVKRYFLFNRYGRPVIYFGGYGTKSVKDTFLEVCSRDLRDEGLLSYFKPMSSAPPNLNYDLYAESEWRMIFLENNGEYEGLLKKRLLIDPRDEGNREAHAYFQGLESEQRDKLRYLIPLDGWFSMIIYPSQVVKNEVQRDTKLGIAEKIEKTRWGAIAVEKESRPIEVTLDNCRNF
ncbi:MAG: hypothetical protein HY562_00160 [Ignavibacteriales bacterium]|nr:hypothetical protein [Ignavibacteriales bacterium]